MSEQAAAMSLVNVSVVSPWWSRGGGVVHFAIGKRARVYVECGICLCGSLGKPASIALVMGFKASMIR